MRVRYGPAEVRDRRLHVADSRSFLSRIHIHQYVPKWLVSMADKVATMCFDEELAPLRLLSNTPLVDSSNLRFFTVNFWDVDVVHTYSVDEMAICTE